MDSSRLPVARQQAIEVGGIGSKVDVDYIVAESFHTCSLCPLGSCHSNPIKREEVGAKSSPKNESVRHLLSVRDILYTRVALEHR